MKTLTPITGRATVRSLCAIAATLLACTAAHAGYSPTTNFVDPEYWSVGSTDSTYQEWDDLQSSTPDIGYSANPALGSTSTMAPDSPGFATSSGNYYSFSGNYGFTGTIYNHGGSSGAGSYSSSFGTHIIIQTASTLNGDGIFSNSVEILDSLGASVTGGDNASALRHSVLFEGVVTSSFGDVTLREEIWEFYLPGYVDDFQVVGDIMVHASLDRIRVDSFVTDQSIDITAVPEPSTYALGLGVAVIGCAMIRRRMRKA